MYRFVLCSIGAVVLSSAELQAGIAGSSPPPAIQRSAFGGISGEGQPPASVGQRSGFGVAGTSTIPGMLREAAGIAGTSPIPGRYRDAASFGIEGVEKPPAARHALVKESSSSFGIFSFVDWLLALFGIG